MDSSSHLNSATMYSGNLLNPRVESPLSIQQAMIVPGVTSSNVDTSGIEHVDSDCSSPTSTSGKVVIVSNMLPLHAQKDEETDSWTFSFDEDSPLVQLTDGFSPETLVFYVGSLKADIDDKQQEEVAKKLLDDFNCVPTFLPEDIHMKFYHGFCKHRLWPIFHSMLLMCLNHGDHFDNELWQAYISANSTFAKKVWEVANPEEDYIWIHDYHLMVLPTFLRKHYYRAKLGFFLHSPFPALTIYETLPVRNEILRGLLNCDLIGFQTFNYAGNFLSCCRRMLGLDYKPKHEHIGVDYCGRTVYIKVLPVGIHVGRLESVLNHPLTLVKLKKINEHLKGKKVILGVDDMDILKGISLKLLAFEKLLEKYEYLQGGLVLVQIVNPARSQGKDVLEVERETYLTANRINEAYGSPDYEPVILIDRHVDSFEKSAYYAVAECCIVNAVMDGMNLVPYKYVVCRQGSQAIDEAIGVKSDSPRTSVLVLSEFIGCSTSLSKTIKINPWDIQAVAEAMYLAINMSGGSSSQIMHEKHYQYVKSHDLAYWAGSFLQDMKIACKDNCDKRCLGLGFGLTFRVVAFSSGFRRLSTDHIIPAYRRTNRRAIFLDFDGTLVPQSSVNRTPSSVVISALNTVCDDPKNTVFVVSGRSRSYLGELLAPCEGLGLAAEHGYFTRWPRTSDWQSNLVAVLGWKEVAVPIMQQYTESTDGSDIEIKETAIVWHYQFTNPDFGACQAKELLDHLNGVLVKEPVVVTRGDQIVEVKPKGASKDVVAKKVLSAMVDEGKAPDFILCIGNDRSDEKMFEYILNNTQSPTTSSVPDVFACTVGQQPSKATYYLNGTSDVQELLEHLADVSSSNPGS